MRTDKQRKAAVDYLNRHPEQREKQRVRALAAIRAKRAADPATQKRLAVYQELVALYGEKCAICGIDPLPTRRLSIDHDHATDEIRGLLCGNCNLMLGRARDSVEILTNALKYLARDAYTGRMFAELLIVAEDAA